MALLAKLKEALDLYDRMELNMIKKVLAKRSRAIRTCAPGGFAVPPKATKASLARLIRDFEALGCVTCSDAYMKRLKVTRSKTNPDRLIVRLLSTPKRKGRT
jgi:phage tail sheath gpL-like